MIDAADALADYRLRHPGPPLTSAGRLYRQNAPELIRCTIRPVTAETWLQSHFYTPQAQTILLEISARYAALMAIEAALRSWWRARMSAPIVCERISGVYHLRHSRALYAFYSSGY